MKFLRFMYINIYSFLLFILGVLIFLLPLEVFLLLAKIACALWAAYNGAYLLSLWKGKNRKMMTLLARNRKEIRPDTFRKLKGTLCGRLMVNLTLADLRKTGNYSSLSKAEWKEQKKRVFESTTPP